MESPKIKLIIIDDEDAFRELLVRRFSKPEFDVTGCATAEEAIRVAKSKTLDVGVLDIRMPGISGVDLLRELKILQPDFEAIMLTGQATIDSAIKTMKLGAYDYLPKPCKLFELEIIIRKAYEKKMLREQNSRLRDQLRRGVVQSRIVGSNSKVKTLRHMISKLARTSEPVLIQGETGVGKELTAKAIHYESDRKESPFVSVNCGVLTGGMLELELFGHEANAFLGSGPQRRGVLENVDGGSVFLAEVEQMSPAVQVKILQFLDTGEFTRIGGYREIFADTRLFFSTSQDLFRVTQNGDFRDDFYYKISALSVTVPPLRERKEDIPEIVEYIIANSRQTPYRNKRLSKKAFDSLMKYNWPSNVRELTNVVERALSLAPKNVVQMKDLPISFEKKVRLGRLRHLQSLAEIEKEHILYVLDAVNGNISKAARVLGISRPKLYRKTEKYHSGPQA